MQNNNRKVFETFISRTKIYLAIILVLLIIMCVENNKLIIPSIIVYLAIVGYTYYANRKRKSEISEQLQDLTLTVDSAAKSSLINAPFPLIIIETDGNVVWKSSKFITEFANIDINNYIILEFFTEFLHVTDTIHIVKKLILMFTVFLLLFHKSSIVYILFYNLRILGQLPTYKAFAADCHITVTKCNYRRMVFQCQ